MYTFAATVEKMCHCICFLINRLTVKQLFYISPILYSKKGIQGSNIETIYLLWFFCIIKRYCHFWCCEYFYTHHFFAASCAYCGSKLLLNYYLCLTSNLTSGRYKRQFVVEMSPELFEVTDFHSLFLNNLTFYALR